MIIVLEGPDGAGKTTLAAHLAARYGATIQHVGPPTNAQRAGIDTLLHHYASLLEDARASGRRMIFDRLALGERVYGPILRGIDGLGEDGWALLNRLMMGTGAVQILCLPPRDVCHAAWASGREELLRKVEQFDAAYAGYVALQETQDHVYDRTAPNALPALDRFIDYCTGIRQPRPLPTGMIGSLTPRYVFVGDQARAIDLPFFSRRGSSQYLNRALVRAGFEEHQIALVNAHRLDGQQRSLALWHAGVQRYVSLGDRAAAVCEAQGLNHTLVRHPQYWRRFHESDAEAFVNALRAIRSAR